MDKAEVKWGFDFRKPATGPSSNFIPDRKVGGWTSLCFSMDNKKLVAMNKRGNVLIDLVSEEIAMPLPIGEVDGMATAL